MYEICMGALEAGESLLRPGRAGEGDRRRGPRPFRLARPGRLLSPRTRGHGLGLGHPEPPYLVPESTETLQAHDVVALEPGLYVPGVGGMRFERNYLITAGVHETPHAAPAGAARRDRRRAAIRPPRPTRSALQGRLVVGLLGDLGDDLGRR